MITEQLQKKINFAIFLLRSVYDGYKKPLMIAYSGGKDSDVILQLAKESGVEYVAIYNNTTIDPIGTVAHVKKMGAKVIQPKESFLHIVAKRGFPNRFRRFCCEQLKEKKVPGFEKVVIGVRKAESTKRAKRYNSPTECKYYGAKKEENHVEAIYPILEWTDDDVKDFILDRGIECAPAYYDKNGEFHVERRLGCVGCPLAYYKKRIDDFKNQPNLVRQLVRYGQIFFDRGTKISTYHDDIYEFVYMNIFDKTYEEMKAIKNGMFGKPNFKEYLEELFGVDLTINNKTFTERFM